jgi:zinc protease
MNRAGFGSLAGIYFSAITLGLPLDEEDREARAVQAMTPEAIMAAYKRWIRPDDLAEIVRGPAPK